MKPERRGLGRRRVVRGTQIQHCRRPRNDELSLPVSNAMKGRVKSKHGLINTCLYAIQEAEANATKDRYIMIKHNENYTWIKLTSVVPD